MSGSAEYAKYRVDGMVYLLTSKGVKLLLMSIVISVLFACSLDRVIAQTGSVIKAAYIEKLTRFIEWPEAGLTADNKNFQICIVGNGNMLDTMRELAALTPVKGKPLKVSKINRSLSLKGCRLVYLATDNPAEVNAVVSATHDKPILTIGDGEGLGQQGVMINFYETNNQLRFEINLDAAKQSGFMISSRLLKVARIVSFEGRGE